MAVSICSALTLADDHGGTYVFVLVFTVPATFIGIGLKGRFDPIAERLAFKIHFGNRLPN